MHAPCEEKSDDSKDSIYDELEQGFFLIIFLSTIQKFRYAILMQKWGERIFLNQQMVMRVYIRIVMIMVLE